MADILGSIFGTSSTQDQTTTPDPVAQALNIQRLQQLINFFDNAGAISQFGTPNDYLSQPTDFSRNISDIAWQRMRDTPGVDYSSIPSFEDYKASFDPTKEAYRQSQDTLQQLSVAAQGANVQDYNTVRGNVLSSLYPALQRSYSDFGTGVNAAGSTYGQVSSDIQADYNAAIARGDYDLARSLSTNEAYANRALGTNTANLNTGLNVNQSNLLQSLGVADTDALRSLITQNLNRQQALDLGIGATDNYISQIATPRINQAMALQGLESGGAVPQAIARATAETAIPYLQNIESIYGTNQANTLNQLMALKGGLTGNLSAQDAALLSQYLGLQSGVNTQLAGQQGAATEAAAAGNRQLGGQLMSLQGQAGNTYQNNVNQLAQALMQNNVTLEQAGIAADSALGQQLVSAQNALRLQQQQGGVALSNTFMPLSAAFAQSVPQVGAALAALPGQLQAQNTSNLTALQPIADYSRQLAENDYLRRQGLFTSLYTGIPFQPGSSTQQTSATGNLFNQLGGFFSSVSTGGTKGGTGGQYA